MKELKITDYTPDSMIISYRSEHHDKFYLESAKLSNKHGKLEPGAFSPVSMSLMKKIAETVSKNYNSFEYNALESNNLINFAINGTSVKMAWVTQPCVRELFFTKEMGLENGFYPVPKLIFSIDDEDLDVFAVRRNDKLTADTVLYNAPFGNISEDGSVCMGSVRTKAKIPSLVKLMQKWEVLFFKSYFTHTNNDKIIKGNLVTLFKSLKGKDSFPDDVLVPTKFKLSKLTK